MKYRIYRIAAILFIGILLPVFLSDAQTKYVKYTSKTIGNEEKITDVLVENTIENQVEKTLIGTDTGLFLIENDKKTPLWLEGSVQKIIRTNKWFFLTDKGIISSTDLITFEECNEGLPFHIIKHFENGEKSFLKQAASLKDLQIHPEYPEIMVTLTRDSVFLSKDSGQNWVNLGFSAKTNGAKAVAVADLPDETGLKTLTVFVSHAIYGLSYITPDKPDAQWIDIEDGIAIMPTMTNPDEISDILAVRTLDESSNVITEIYFAQTFLPCIYKLDWATKKAILLGRSEEPVDTIDSLFTIGNKILYVKPDEFGCFDIPTAQFLGKPSASSRWKELIKTAESHPLCAYFPTSETGYGQPVSMSELWMLDTSTLSGSHANTALDKKAIYVPAGHVATPDRLDRFLDIIQKNKLNSIVIDMKDDYGLLRYETKDPFVLEKASVSQYAIDLEDLIKRSNDLGLYLVARIVVFKDKALWQYNNSKYAVYDSKAKKPWQGIRRYGNKNDESTTNDETVYYDEHWVDPYCEEVWTYNIAIAKELISYGFDEIQFDYIRFPTDGYNLASAQYRWREKSMDMESALISFLKYARENLDVPIGIDIYGANGWYRSGARTGQDVEQLSQYVDVICPMFYPSHFEQNFLAYTPIVERPYRVYFFGCYRNTVIARNRIVVRPWIQSFYLPVSYDKIFYDSNYVKRQVFGVRDSIDRGYMFWNNAGRYTDVSSDPGNQEYPWTSVEADTKYRKPALGKKVVE